MLLQRADVQLFSIFVALKSDNKLQMKNINYILHGVLGAAVIALFALQFTGGSETANKTPERTTDSTVVAANGTIAYFVIDSVLTNWELYFQVQEELAAKQTSMSTDFDSKSQGFMKRVEDAQYKIQRGLVTRAEAEQLQQQLAAEEQNLMGLQNDYAVQLQEEGIVRNRQMVDKLEQYLKEYNVDKGYSYIFSYTFGGNLLYGNQAFDITQEVIDGINAAYPAEEE